MLPLRLDVTDNAAVAALPATLPEGWRQVDALINNAGLALGLEPAQEADAGGLGPHGGDQRHRRSST